MRRLAIALTVMLAATAAFAMTTTTIAARPRMFERNIHFDDERTYVKKEVIEAGTLRSLKAAVSDAPISFEGSNAAGYTITVCKAATSPADLDAIRVTLDGNALRAEGPSQGRKRRWTVIYHVRARARGHRRRRTERSVAFRDVDGRSSRARRTDRCR
jgi:hypothetical protein